ncbi:MAG: hypothetical protein LBI87_15065 [Candidatus Accumulibacter sp.]|jgi:Tfp pilus assembly protein PilX|nr:hypothetical protein [Accumulibacter sp.]
MNMKNRLRQNRPRRFPARVPAAFRQRGAVLLIALIVLVAMTLSALALIRSVNTTNLIAGNLAFRESAVLAAERATESAVNWLVSAGRSTLESDVTGEGYQAVRADPADGNWEAFWNNTGSGAKKAALTTAGAGSDAAGNTVSYVIHRLCDATGNPLSGINCSKPPRDGGGGSMVAGAPSAGLKNPQVYYRITARVVGPRNTVVYTQTTIAL